MSELREDIHKNDFLMDKLSKDLWFVVKITTHTIWLRSEKPEDRNNDDPDIRELPKNIVNLSMIKVNKNTVEILYDEKNTSIDYGDSKQP